ncbi:MAG: cyclase family protein [Armatimonas sp.]
MELIDISRPLQNGMPVWPGDTEYQLTQTAWGNITVGAATLSLHSGTHVDAPSHFRPGDRTIDTIPLGLYIGECVVVDVRFCDVIGPEMFSAVLPPRVLFRTDAWPEGAPFPESVPTLSNAAIRWLHRSGVWLVGVDVPSVDAIDSKDLPIHHALAASGIHILESLDLSQVAPGNYELIALPLPIIGGDASPVRAVLRPLTR